MGAALVLLLVGLGAMAAGVLIGRYYVKRLGGDRRVQTLVTLGTPHNGTPTAYLGIATMGLVAPSVWQMTPMSPFIRRLKAGPFPEQVRFASIYSKADRFSPFPSALLESGDQPNLRNIEVADCAHRALLTQKRVYDLVHGELRAGEEARLRREQATPGHRPGKPPLRIA